MSAGEMQIAEVESWNDLSRRRAGQATSMNGYTAPTDPPPGLYVRALYNYDADDHTSLSFREGDIIQVLKQLESGWWDGVINDVRGWFPSNYCAIIASPEDPGELGLAARDESDTSADSGMEEEEYDDGESGDDQDEDSDLPIEGGDSHTQEEAAYWIPQATPDGRLFYFNTLTGVSTMELPLETPTSDDETGPRDRTNFHVPDQTRPPPEMMARGFEQNMVDYDSSTSDGDGENGMSSSQYSLPDRRRSFLSADVSSSDSTESLNANATNYNQRTLQGLGQSITISQQLDTSMPPIGTTTTSFTTAPHQLLAKPAASRYFPDEGITTPLTWDSLVENMRMSIDAYRQAIRNHERADFVRRAEDISDHLRMLLAAGSGTTDNHSGNPSIISANKALYPHFREMMSKFSKLVLSSHIAAADWPGPDAFAKCLQEADGVMHGVYGYVDIARQQRGEQIPRITPGFVLGSNTGGNWQDNNIDSHLGMDGNSFIHQDDLDSRPLTASLDAALLRRIDDARKVLSGSLHQLEEHLQFSEKVITHSRQVALGDNICAAAVVVIEYYRPWITEVEGIDLAPVSSIFHQPQMVDFSAQKQSVYDAIGELVAACQAITTPLPDEWAEVRGQSLETRLDAVRNSCRQLDNQTTHVGYSLKLLLEASMNKREQRMTGGGETYQTAHHRSEPSATSIQRPLLAEIGQSHSYTIGQEHPAEKFRRPININKARQFFGQIPPSHAALKGLNIEPIIITDENPWYLQLDHINEVSYTDTDPPQVKSGTLTGLVETLTRHDRLDPSFNSTFLLTYRSFMSAAELFERLVGRFNIQPPPGLTRQEYPTWEELKQKTVRIRVVNILKSWFEQYWMEINDDANQLLLERAYSFAKNTIANTNTPGSKLLITVIYQRMKGQDTSSKRLVLTLNTSAPPPILPKNMKKLKFLDIDATEFARQLTIVESKLYGKIKPIECLDKTWQKKPKNDDGVELAPNVKSLILHSNQLTNWVAEMILSQPEVKKRVAVIKHFVAIADVSSHEEVLGLY
jgi:son of sevenless